MDNTRGLDKEGDHKRDLNLILFWLSKNNKQFVVCMYVVGAMLCICEAC